MLKKFFRFVFVLIFILIGSLIGFYYWGSSPTIPKSQYIANVAHQKATPPNNDSIFTIITYNIGYLSGLTNGMVAERSQEFLYQNLATVIQTFKQLTPDIVAYQEIDFAGSRTFDLNQSEKIAQACGFAYQLDAVNWDKQYVPFPYSWNPQHHFGRVLSGQAIHSRFPMLAHERLVLERPSSRPFYENAFFITYILFKYTQI